jgi:hypothetical protein
MRIGWEKRGLVYTAPGTALQKSHAMLPTPHMMQDRIRVLVACCDNDMRGRIFRVDLDRDNPLRVIEAAEAPVLDIGPVGSFDADGVNPSQIVERDGLLLLYYIGWERLSDEVPYTLFVGVAESLDGGLSFTKRDTGQVLHGIGAERYFRTAPFVFPERDGWGMLYIGGGNFFDGPQGKRLPTYSLCLAHSSDGLCWDAQPSPPLLNPERERGEIGFGRPVLWHEDGQASLIVSLRTEAGYSLRQVKESRGKLVWSTLFEDDEVEDWESDMTCFGAPCRSDDWEYLFYNGNQFGRFGFGVARRAPQRKAESGAAAPLIAALRRANGPKRQDVIQ